MSTRDPLSTMTTLCVLVVIVGVGALGVGLMLYRYHHAVDVAVEADQELLERLNSHQPTSSGSGMTLDRYANASLGYHRSIVRLFRAIANAFLLCGAVLTITGALQLRALRTLRRRLASNEQPHYESSAT